MPRGVQFKYMFQRKTKPQDKLQGRVVAASDLCMPVNYRELLPVVKEAIWLNVHDLVDLCNCG